MRFADLLENYIIVKDKDKELYYDIKDNVNNYMEMIKEYLSYELIVKDQFIKLEKVPSNPQSFMGIKEFTSIKEYIFFMIVLIYLEDKNNEEQFILSNLTEFISQNYNDKKIEWTKLRNRKYLINVMKVSLDMGLIKRNDGDEDLFSKDENMEVLYESTGISRYVLRGFDKELDNVSSYKDLLDTSNTKYNVYRDLLLSPVVYNNDEAHIEYDYINKNIGTIKDVFEKYLEWDIHLYKNAALAIIANNEVRDVFPNRKGECSVVLLLSKKIREIINTLDLKENDIIYFEKEEFNNILLDLRKESGHGFTKTLRECSEELYIYEIKQYMKSFMMLNEMDELNLIMPIVGKMIGDYPKDYKEKMYEQQVDCK